MNHQSQPPPSIPPVLRVTAAPRAEEPLEIDANRIVRVTIGTKRLEATAARRLLSDVRDAFGNGARLVVIDLTGVTFIDSLGVAALAGCARYALGHGSIALTGLGPYAKTIAQITHLGEVLPIYETFAAAAAAL